MAVIDPRTWADHDILDWKTVKTELFDPIKFLLNPPMVEVQKQAAQSIPNATFTTITWDTVTVDTEGMYDAATSTSRIVCKVAGVYRGFWQVGFPAGPTNGRVIGQLLKNGSITDLNTRDDTRRTGKMLRGGMPFDITLAVNDYVELQAYQDQTAPASQNTDTSTVNWWTMLHLRWRKVAP